MSAPPLSEEQRRGALLTVFLVVFIDLLGFGIMIPQLPLISDRILTSLLPDEKFTSLRGFLIGTLFASFSAMQFIFAPMWGRLSDRIGRRPVILAGLVSSVVFYSLFGVAAAIGSGEHKLLGMVLLFVTRIGAGIAGATIGVAQAVIADVTTPEKRSHGMALIGAAFGIGFTVGPALGALIIYFAPHEHGLVGYAAGLMSAAALLVALRRLSETLAPGHAIATDRGHSFARLWSALLTPRIGLVILSFFLATFAFANFETTLALLNKSFGFGDGQNALVFTLIGATLLFASGVIYRRVADKFTEVALLTFGVSGMVIGLALLGLVTHYAVLPGEPGRNWMLAAFFLSLIITVTGFSFLNPSIQSLISKRCDPNRQGEFLGVNQSAAALARVVGPAAGPFLFSLGMRHVLPFAVAATAMAMVLMLIPRLRDG